MSVVMHQKITPRASAFKKRPETREEKMINSLSPTLNLMVKAVRRASSSLLRDFHEVAHLQLSKKGPGDFVSSADLMTEKKLISYLQEAKPDYGIISEECGKIPAKNDSPYCWVIDPIDGTNNFIHANPTFAISLALMRGDEVLDAVIFNPVLNELYYAEKGQGAFVMRPTGDERLRVSNRRSLETTILSVNGSFLSAYPETMAEFLKKNMSVRINGSITLALSAVSAGQSDVFADSRIHLWDIVTGYLLVKEAGGIVQSWSGKTSLKDIVEEGSFLATTMELRDEVVKFLPKVKKNLQKK